MIKKNLKILFVGPLNHGSTCNARLDALQKIKNDVKSIDTSFWLNSNFNFINTITNRFFISTKVYQINKSILNFIKLNPIDLVWIEKGEYIYPWTLFKIKAKNIKLINYNTDNIFSKKGNFWLHNLGIKHYDIYLTTNRLNVLEIRNRFNIKAYRVAMGYDANLHFTINNSENKVYDIVFIGHWEPHTEKYLMKLINAGIRVNIWGHGWKRAINSELKKVLPLSQTNYVEVISKSKIALCFLSKWNKNETTGRSFEIPAIGTLMLAEYSKEHKYIYNDGAIFFNDEIELLNNVIFYLNNFQERDKVAKKGNLISKNPGYSWQDNLFREWPLIIEQLKSMNLVNFKSDIFWNSYHDGSEFIQINHNSE